MVPWARRKSAYTRDFEQQTAWPGVHAPRRAVSRLMRMDWKGVGPVCRRVADDLRAEQGPGLFCFASMFVRQVRQCFSAVWADGFPRCRHRFPVM